MQFHFTPATLTTIRAHVAAGTLERDIAATLGCELGTLRTIMRTHGIASAPPIVPDDEDGRFEGPRGWPRAWPLPITRR